MRKRIKLVLVQRSGMRGHIDYKVTNHPVHIYIDRLAAWSDRMVVVDGNRFEVMEGASEISQMIAVAEQVPA